MNDLDMQFADPEWRPPRKQEVGFDKPEPEETYSAQPLKRDVPLSQRQEGIEDPERQEGELPIAEPYAGLGPQQLRPDGPLRIQEQNYQEPASRYWSAMPVQRRRRSNLAWILVAIFVCLLTFSGLIGAMSHRMDPWGGPGFRGFGMEHPMPVQMYSVQNHPTVIINEAFGAIHITADASDANTVRIDSSGSFSQKDQGQSGLNYNYDKLRNTVTVTENPGDVNSDMTVQVPTTADLQIQTDGGSIDVDGVNGQMALHSNAGSIHVANSILEGGSVLQAGAGSVSFAGSLTPRGSYDFESALGSVSAMLPADSSFHLDAKTDLGSIASDFSALVPHGGQGPGAEVHGTVGSETDTILTMKSHAGSININNH